MVKKLIIQSPGGTTEEQMKSIREQFKNNDIVFIGPQYVITEIEYDEDL